MASKSFELNVDPHVATVGPYEFKFVPETNGARFAGAYSELREAQKLLTDAGDNVGEKELLAVGEGMRVFLSKFMLPESAELFATVTLPDRILVQLLEWVAETLGGGAGKAGGSSTE